MIKSEKICLFRCIVTTIPEHCDNSFYSDPTLDLFTYFTLSLPKFILGRFYGN